MKKIIIFQPIMDGWKRKCIVKDTVNGYKHEEESGIHFFTRGNIQYTFNSNTESVEMMKYNISTKERLYISYEEVEKFIDIEKVKRIS